MRIDYFANLVLPLLEVDASCLNCGGELRHVTTGRVICGREGSVIFRCTDCSREHQLHVTLSLTKLIAESPLAHGTDKGYQRHLRNGTTVCDPCQEAHAVEANRRNHGLRLVEV